MYRNPERSLMRQRAHEAAKKWSSTEHYRDRAGRTWVVYPSGTEHHAGGIMTPEWTAEQDQIRGEEREAVVAELRRVIEAYANPDPEIGWRGISDALIDGMAHEEMAEELAAYITEHTDLDLEPRYRVEGDG